MSSYILTAIIWFEDNVYVSRCPEIEVSSCGDTPEEALANLKEAIELWIENARFLNILDDYLPNITSKTKFTSSIEIKV